MTVRFNTYSREDATVANFSVEDGIIEINCDVITESVKSEAFCNLEELIFWNIVDALNHEWFHKLTSESLDDSETFNEQDERVMCVCRDWIQEGRKSSIVEYDNQ